MKLTKIAGGRRRRKDKARRSAVGAPPGTLEADPQAEASVISVVALGGGESLYRRDVTVDAALALRGEWPLVWIDCSGLADIAAIRAIGDAYGLHPLSLEDVVDTEQRPKCEVQSDHAFVVMRMLDREGSSEQLSLFFGEGFVLTFQERAGDSFEPVRQRIAKGAPRLLAGHADYLAYALIDAVIDAYFPVVDGQIGRVERLEDDILAGVVGDQVRELHGLRRELLGLKSWLRPTRDALGVILRLDRPWLRPETRVYFADVQDHADQLIDTNETYRDTASGLIDLHMTLSAAKTNEVINLLTIISTIFIPLSFFAGLWGMNFNPEISDWNMPLTQHPYGYPIAISFMATLALGLLAYFRKRRWL
ncbi:magnesium/cobalt transporter CorA [Aurantimonas sp. A2-1-M11]|uniref:magnesium/cobalt transporter CorA n=1 Tax=Aurantimonas sp. A2-1-M11 TaxID=3113712 RepID=UPI002F9503E5